jgi:DNA-directed RNA polymerase subunit F
MKFVKHKDEEETDFINEFESALDYLTQFAKAWIRGEITDLEGPSRTEVIGPDAIMTEIHPADWPNLTVTLIEKESRILGTRIGLAEYMVPVIEVPPPTAMMASDA